MIFDVPTTKTELYETLNEIYYFYKVQRIEFEGLSLEPLKLGRMSFTPLTEEELMEKAEYLVAAKQEERLSAYIDGLKEKISSERLKISAAEEKCKTLKEEYDKTCYSAKNALESLAVKNGVANSGVYAQKKAEIERKNGEKKAEAVAECEAAKAEAEGRIAEYNSLIDGAEQKYSSLAEKEITEKYLALKDEQDKTVREVFKYNNGLDEKEQRYLNTINQSRASVALRHLEIRLQGQTKDELVESGYYADVIDCVVGYYNTMSPSAAYSDIKAEAKLAIYLDDYYSGIVYFYKVNAD